MNFMKDIFTNCFSQTQSPGPKKTEEINRPMREYRRYVPPSPERGGANVGTRGISIFKKWKSKNSMTI